MKRSIILVAALLGPLPALTTRAMAADNGIYVAEPKLFDARALYLMLEELEAQLGRVSAVDPQTLATALGKLQGQTTRDLALAAALTGQPISKLETTLEPGTITEDLAPSKSVETRSELTPQPPTLPTSVNVPSSGLGFGLHAQDLLTDQVSLTYQILSLRLLLQRALSDRLIGGEPRQQAILGFRVNVDPPREARKMAAFVEITIVPRCPESNTRTGDRDQLSVVALMPQEKTYNASSVSTKTGQFGGAAIAGVFSLGVNVKKTNQVFYLYRDSDTLSYPNLPTGAAHDPGAVTFGWQFRPVLGRESVSAEPRQLLAVLALPQTDIGTDAGDLELEAHVRTYWRRYHRRSQTSRKKPLLEDPSRPLGRIAAWKSGWFEESLRPSIERVSWSTIGDNRALVTVHGKNFFSGTRVLLGSSTIDERSGLILKSDQTLEFTTSLAALANQDGRLSGRFGASVDLTGASSGDGILMNEASVSSAFDRRLVMLSVVLQHSGGKDLVLTHSFQPLLAMDGTPLPGPYKLFETVCHPLDPRTRAISTLGKKCVQVDAVVPAGKFQKDVMVSARVPLYGPAWNTSYIVQHTATQLRAEKVGGTDPVTLAIHGWAFDADWKVLLDHLYAPVVAGSAPAGEPGPDAPVQVELASKDLLLVHAKKDLLAQYGKLGIYNPATRAFETLSVPGFYEPTPKAALEPAGQVRSVTRDSAVAANFTGSHLSKIERVYFGKDELRFTKTANEVTIFLTRAVTAKAGEVDLLIQAEGGTNLIARVSVTG